MSKLQSGHRAKLSKARDVRPADSVAESTGASFNRIGSSSDEGVWSAALAMGFASFLMPVWFLAAGTVFTAHADGSHGNSIHIAHLATLVMGALVVCGGAFAAWILARAPRLARGAHRTALRATAIGCVVGAVLFINCCLNDLSGLSEDAVACAAALLPAILMAEVSIAVPAISRNRHGAGVARLGTLAWLAAGATLMAVGANPAAWWLPLVVSLGGAYCTGLASMRIWRRYEGRIVLA